MTEERHRTALLGAVADVFEGLGLPPKTVGHSRSMPCYDLTGELTGERHVEFSAGDGIPKGSITGDALDGLIRLLGLSPSEDSRNDGTVEKYRLVRFSGVRDGITVFVSIRLDDDRSCFISAQTGCP